MTSICYSAPPLAHCRGATGTLGGRLHRHTCRIGPRNVVRFARSAGAVTCGVEREYVDSRGTALRGAAQDLPAGSWPDAGTVGRDGGPQRPRNPRAGGRRAPSPLSGYLAPACIGAPALARRAARIHGGGFTH